MIDESISDGQRCKNRGIFVLSLTRGGMMMGLNERGGERSVFIELGGEWSCG